MTQNGSRVEKGASLMPDKVDSVSRPVPLPELDCHPQTGHRKSRFHWQSKPIKRPRCFEALDSS